MARGCIKALDKNIWHSRISIGTKLRLYNLFILPVLRYGADTCSLTAVLSRKLDACDQWGLRRILGIN